MLATLINGLNKTFFLERSLSSFNERGFPCFFGAEKIKTHKISRQTTTIELGFPCRALIMFENKYTDFLPNINQTISWNSNLETEKFREAFSLIQLQVVVWLFT